MENSKIFRSILNNDENCINREITHSNTKVDRFFQNEDIDIGRLEMNKGAVLYIEPLGIFRSYLIVEGACEDLETNDVFHTGDLFVYEGKEKLTSLLMHKKTIFLVHSQKNGVLNSFKENTNKILGILKEIQEKDNYTKEHSYRVFELVKKMALRLGYHSERLFNINRAARFHDVGKLYIPDVVLNKPSRLNEDEYKVIKEHVALSEEIIKRSFNGDIYKIISQHHERLDGSGYPKGLKGDEIIEEAKILAICDSYDAMTTDRVYKKGKSSVEAISELKALSGILYDEKLVDVFIEIIREISTDKVG